MRQSCMVRFLLYLNEDETLEVAADDYRHENGELVFSLNGEVVTRVLVSNVLLIDEIRPDVGLN